MYDVLIIGSGPIGATFARLISAEKPEAKILMLDAGPQLTQQAGQHIKNIADPAAQSEAQIKSQGNRQSPYPMISVAERAQAAQRGELNADVLARAGTHLVTDQLADLLQNQMPAASMSTNIGGMGAHWTCACPRPGNAERIPFISNAEMNLALDKAEALLSVTQGAFPRSPEGLAIQNTLGAIFNPILSPDRQVQPMPLACKIDSSGERYWAGADVVLGPLAAQDFQGNFELRSETLCRRLLYTGDTVSAALIEYLPTGQQEQVEAKIVVVAADALRTPQLLWASGIRPQALGHYLNEHPFIFTFVELKDELVDHSTAQAYDPSQRNEPTIGVFWVPFDDPGHPFHGQIMHMDLSPMKTNTYNNPKHIVGLGWGCLKEVQYADQIVFSKTETDYLGMPKMSFRFTYTEKDKASIAAAKAMQAKAMQAFGKVIKDGDQTLMPAGSSLHYGGTTRIGPIDDGSSVCDTYSRVWGYQNLFLGGNGMIPMATTSNPTLTSVALAVRSAEKIIALL